MKTWGRYGPVVLLLAGLAVVTLYLRVNAAAFGPRPATLRFAFQLMLAGTVIAVLRNEVGFSTFGVFGPVILAFAWLAVGPVWGFLFVAYVFIVTVAARSALTGLDLGTAHRVATLLVVAIVAVFVMVTVGRVQGTPPFDAVLLFPVVLTTWYAERFVQGVTASGWAQPTRRLALTVVAISAAYLVAGYDPLVTAVVENPELWVVLAGLNVALGTKTSMRLGEYLRFRTLRRALAAENPSDVLTMRVRNREFISRYNPASLLASYDKVEMKQRFHGLGIPTPETLLVVADETDLAALRDLVATRDLFVIKPVDGSGGDRILVVSGRDAPDGTFTTNRGQLTAEEVVAHARDICVGGLADYGERSRAVVEELVTPDGLLADRVTAGVPDLRVITLHGYPVMAMARLPTEESRGTANLHVGAVGVAVDIATGVASGGYQQTRRAFLDEHPDTGRRSRSRFPTGSASSLSRRGRPSPPGSATPASTWSSTRFGARWCSK
ncbi:sugar-transfer associated ATP-grasp domain-containing protein [Haloarcula regularis]|uniref:sugar-transfer associated ATP-grasp domain-containing protein n=1 Tax=Haloarcula regularis TaxID=3033392 RepID=UPI0023E77331|nr:sugar-transfer associated ATP-grasp domain-containing protein [Halomicroarcula sp. SYNS111]